MKKRLDVLIFEAGHAESREKAQALVMSGLVYANGQKQDKPGTQFDEKTEFEVRGKANKYVSRGGLKLEKAVEAFHLDLSGKTAMDVGASTGGFTDCMLQNGAARVYAVDVGYGQLAWSLRSDPRVVSFERTNIRYITRDEVPEPLDFVSVDVSFISLTLVLPVVKTFMKPGAHAVCLIKPQFEAGREKVGKKGVVRERSTHIEVIEKIVSFSTGLNFFVPGLDFSPVKGPEGNIEYLVHLVNTDRPAEITSEAIREIVGKSHEKLI